MIDKSNIDPNALNYYRMLKDSGFAAYFVGGAVRDLLLGKTPKDFDIATNATPQQIKRVIPYGRIIGRRFRHVMLERDGGRYEIVTFRGQILHAEKELLSSEENSEENASAEIEIADEAVNEAGQGRKPYPDLNQFGTAEQDALRRDFTVNALFYDPDVDELVDYVEGKRDLDDRLLRSIGDPFVRLEEDPIRILRAIRHKVKLGLDYESQLAEAMSSKAPLLANTSKDRIREEFTKICTDRTLGDFLAEAKRLEIIQHFAPWFDSLSENEWEFAFNLWRQFAQTPVSGKANSELGMGVMVAPLTNSLILEPYKKDLDPNDKNYLPDMKYFLGCEKFREYLLRNLRISRAQTDHLLRALFYWNRMTGLWIEKGPPRKIVGRLYQHPPALLAARMTQISNILENKITADWITALAEYDPNIKGARPPKIRLDPRPDSHSNTSDVDDSSDINQESSAEVPESTRSNFDQEQSANQEPQEHRYKRKERKEREPEKKISWPIPDHPMIWNGPLHSPVQRPIFHEEQTQRWARKNQTIRAFRPSGVPNQPTDYAALKSHLVSNYKAELPDAKNPEANEPTSQPRERSNNRRHRDRNHRRGHGRRDESNQNASPEQENAGEDLERDHQQRPNAEDSDNIGNSIYAPDPNGNTNDDSVDNLNYQADDEFGDEDIDDNIGNRLDAPPTSGHVGVNGDGVLNSQNSQQRRPHHGGGSNNRNRHRRRRRGGRRGGGHHRGGAPGGAPSSPTE